MNELIISGIIFIVVMVLFILWQPTRLLLREIFLHPLKDSVFVVRDETDGGKEEKPNSDSKRTNNAVGAKA